MLKYDVLTYSTFLFYLDIVSDTIKNHDSCWSRYQIHLVCGFPYVHFSITLNGLY